MKRRTFMHKVVDFASDDYMTFSVWVEHNEEFNTVLTRTVQICKIGDKEISLVDDMFDPQSYNGFNAMMALQTAGLSLTGEMSDEDPAVVLKRLIREYRVAVRDALQFAEGFRKFLFSKMNVMERN